MLFHESHCYTAEPERAACRVWSWGPWNILNGWGFISSCFFLTAMFEKTLSS